MGLVRYARGMSDVPASLVPIIVLAAGASRRMRGADKLLQPIDGTALLRRQALRARAATRGPVIVALPPEPHDRYACLDGLDVTIVPVPDAHDGMNASLRRSFSNLQDAPAACLLLADLPDIDTNDLETVLRAVDPSDGTLIWRATTQDGKPGHPIVFHADVFADIAKLTGDSGARDVVARVAAQGRLRTIALPGTRALCDLDTPEDWAHWRAAHTPDT